MSHNTIKAPPPKSLSPEELELRRTTDQLMKALHAGGRLELVLSAYLEGAGLRGNALVASLLLTANDQMPKVYAGHVKDFLRLDPNAVGRAVSLLIEHTQAQVTSVQASRGLGQDSAGGH